MRSDNSKYISIPFRQKKRSGFEFLDRCPKIWPLNVWMEIETAIVLLSPREESLMMVALQAQWRQLARVTAGLKAHLDYPVYTGLQIAATFLAFPSSKYSPSNHPYTDFLTIHLWSAFFSWEYSYLRHTWLCYNIEAIATKSGNHAFRVHRQSHWLYFCSMAVHLHRQKNRFSPSICSWANTRKIHQPVVFKSNETRAFWARKYRTPLQVW